MRKFVLAAVLLVLALMLGGLAGADDKPKDKDEPPKVGALPPLPLDGAFEKATTVNGITDGLLNNDQFKKAVAAALKAKKDMEQRYKDNPKLAAQTPAQAARQAFLEALQAGPDDKPKDKDKDNK